MAYKKNIFKDKTIVTLSAISIIAAAALIGGIALDSGSNQDNDDTKNIVDLNESDTTNNFADIDINHYSEPETTPYTEPETTSVIPEETTNLAELETTSSIIDEGSDYVVNAPASSLNFTMDSVLSWPVDGNIVIDYDMNNTVYFPTLDLYKCSDAICIQSEIGTPVYASTNCVVKEVAFNDEIGTYIIVDLGNEYALTYGQLKDIVVETNDTLEDGDLIGYVNEPTSYYTLEGPNLYLKLTENDSPINPLDFLNYE